MSEFTIRMIDRISSVPGEAWDACANPGGECADNPFLAHAFLSALEESGSASAKTGWAPRHLLLEDSFGALMGAVPMYLKSHSYGEYVFDHSWAHAFERAGGDYYPKLQVSVPFTPATGRRLLVRPGSDAAQRQAALANAAIKIAQSAGVSSLHFTFLPKAESELLGRAGFLLRTDQQFHWTNNQYRDFEDFLQSLTSRKRKQIHKERREAVAAGISIEILTGAGLKEVHWDAFFQFYKDTGQRKWGQPYLNRKFFSLINQRMPEKIALVLCSRNGRPIAGALNFIGGDTLFGRNWGAIEQHPFLHFEACYYQAIEFAIARGLKRVEAGAQGAHKLARGYLPTLTHSAHWITEPRFRRAVSDYLDQERRAVAHEAQLIAAHAPFRKNQPAGEQQDDR